MRGTEECLMITFVSRRECSSVSAVSLDNPGRTPCNVSDNVNTCINDRHDLHCLLRVVDQFLKPCAVQQLPLPAATEAHSGCSLSYGTPSSCYRSTQCMFAVLQDAFMITMQDVRVVACDAALYLARMIQDCKSPLWYYNTTS